MAAQGASLLMIEYPFGPKNAVETSEENLVQLREAENVVANMKEDLANTPKADREAVTTMKHKVVDAEDKMERSKQTFIDGIINLLCLAEVVPLINSGFNRIVRIRMIEVRLAREQRIMARDAWTAAQELALEGEKLKAQEKLVLASDKRQKQKEYLKLLHFSR